MIIMITNSMTYETPKFNVAFATPFPQSLTRNASTYTFYTVEMDLMRMTIAVRLQMNENVICLE